MTNEEAIEEIKSWTPVLMGMGSKCTEETAEAQSMAIEALNTHDELCENLAWYINERQRLLKKEACAEWLPDDELSFDPARPWWKCSHCYERTGIRTQFCPDCGYKMRCQEDG